MIQQVVVIDKIEALEDGTIQIREATKIMDGSKELAKTYRRWVVTPGQDVSEQDPRVQAVCSVLWTEEVVQAYRDKYPQPEGEE